MERETYLVCLGRMASVRLENQSVRQSFRMTDAAGMPEPCSPDVGRSGNPAVAARNGHSDDSSEDYKVNAQHAKQGAVERRPTSYWTW